MDKVIHAAVDHLSILNFDLNTSTDVFFSLGFVREGNKNTLDESVFEQMVPTSRYVFDNAYMECVQFPSYIGEFYNYLATPAGIHIMTPLTEDAERFRQKLCQRGVIVDELERVVRKNFDYGEKKGTASMLLVPLPYEIVPRTHVAFLEHLTHDLIYQPTRYQHPNGVTTLEEFTICCPDESNMEWIEQELLQLCQLANNDRCIGGARSIRLMDTDTLFHTYGIRLKENGSVFAAVCFGAPDLSPVRACIKKTNYFYRDEGNRIFVNLNEQLGMVFEFREI